MTPHLVEALAWALIHFIWQGAAIALVAALVIAFVDRGGPRIRYAILGGALALMAAAPAATFLARIVPRSEAASFPAAAVAATPLPIVAAQPSIGIAPASATGRLRWVVALWVAGVGLSALHALAGWWRAQLLRRRDVSPADDRLSAARALAARLGLARPVEVLISVRASGPMTLGWWKPVILLPLSTVTALTPSEIEMVLAHELAHIARRDYLVNLLQIAVETMLFYHPAVWWVSRRMRIEREHVADDLAVAVCGDRAGYARAMAALDAQVAPAAVLAANGGSLLARIERLAGVRRPSPSAAPAWLGALIVALVVVAGLVTPPKAIAETAKAAPAEAEPATTAPAKPEKRVHPAPATTTPEAPVRTAPAAATKAAAAAPTSPEGFLGGLTSAGYTHLSIDEIIALSDHGVDARYVQAMSTAGLGRLPVDDLIRLHDHGVRPEFVRGLVESACVSDLATGTAIQLADHGVDPAELRRIRALSFGPFPAETVTTLHDHGVGAASFEVLKAIGPGDDPAGDAIQLHDNGVSMDRIRSMKRQGFEKLTVTQVLALARGGVI